MNAKRFPRLAGAFTCAQLPALAHEGVQDPTVLMRMQSMQEVGGTAGTRGRDTGGNGGVAG